jgi:hypothetical protein
MLVVETIARIRRAYFDQGKSIKAICRELKVSRKVVRKVIQSGDTEFVYERRVQSQPKLGAWRGELDKLLTAKAARPVRELLTVGAASPPSRLPRWIGWTGTTPAACSARSATSAGGGRSQPVRRT